MPSFKLISITKTYGERCKDFLENVNLHIVASILQFILQPVNVLFLGKQAAWQAARLVHHFARELQRLIQ